MSLKNIKTINIFLIFVLMIPLHFIYKLFPNTLFSILFPVNESIFEHMKLIFTTFIISSLIEYLILKKVNIKFNNYILNILLSSLFCILIFLLIYLPIYYNFGENLIITLIILFISITLSQIFSYYLLQLKNIKYLNSISILIIIILYILMSYLTYNPPRLDFFLDPLDMHYGIKKRN